MPENGERVFISPTAVVRALEVHHEPNGRAEGKKIPIEGLGEITLTGGAVKFQGSSWTERHYTVDIPTDEGDARLKVVADPNDGCAAFKLSATRGEESWDIASREDPPQWVQDLVGPLGVRTSVITRTVSK